MLDPLCFPRWLGCLTTASSSVPLWPGSPAGVWVPKAVTPSWQDQCHCGQGLQWVPGKLRPSWHKTTNTDPSMPSSWGAMTGSMAKVAGGLLALHTNPQENHPEEQQTCSSPLCFPKGWSLLNYPKMFEERMQRMYTTSILSHGAQLQHWLPGCHQHPIPRLWD